MTCEQRTRERIVVLPAPVVVPGCCANNGRCIRAASRNDNVCARRKRLVNTPRADIGVGTGRLELPAAEKPLVVLEVEERLALARELIEAADEVIALDVCDLGV